VVCRLTFRLLLSPRGSWSNHPNAAAGTNPRARPRRQMSLPEADYNHLPVLGEFKLAILTSTRKVFPSQTTNSAEIQAFYALLSIFGLCRAKK